MNYFAGDTTDYCNPDRMYLVNFYNTGFEKLLAWLGIEDNRP